jgi:hypothetical protein
VLRSVELISVAPVEVNVADDPHYHVATIRLA